MALLSESILAQRYAEEIKSTNDATQRALCALFDAYIPYINYHQIADALSFQAGQLFRRRTHFRVDDEEVAKCNVIFLLDAFFRPPISSGSSLMPSSYTMTDAAAASSAPHELYIYQTPSYDLFKAVFDTEKRVLSTVEERSLLQLLEEPGTQFYQFQKTLRSVFPSLRVQWSIKRDVPRYVDGRPHLYYGEPRDGLTPFWYIEGALEFPVFTPSLQRALQTHALSVQEQDNEIE
jgi:hypothetical protein